MLSIYISVLWVGLSHNSLFQKVSGQILTISTKVWYNINTVGVTCLNVCPRHEFSFHSNWWAGFFFLFRTNSVVINLKTNCYYHPIAQVQKDVSQHYAEELAKSISSSLTTTPQWIYLGAGLLFPPKSLLGHGKQIFPKD